MKKIILDCNWLCYRSAFGMTSLSYENKSVHVVFDFIRQLLVLAEKFKCHDFVFCWDSRNSWRKVYSPEYKNNRHKDLTAEQAEDLADTYRQMDDLRNMVLPYMGFKNILYQSGYEADDLIAVAVDDLKALDKHCTIVSSDEDLFQLLDINVQLHNFKRNFRLSDFMEQYYSIKASQWAEVKAISGCPGDNVVGIKGVGDKTAAKYIAGILKGKAKDTIESTEGCQIKAFNLPLVRLPYSGKKAIKKLEIVPDEISEDKFQDMFGQYGFKSFLKEENWKKWEEAFEF
ncbi:MAG: hypothetical protein PHO27_12180 [Sulfuricurvum sp.]|jgi:DNA polymerase-1|nr:hypothetical protein [Sulfuricurvum sp.]